MFSLVQGQLKAKYTVAKKLIWEKYDFIVNLWRQKKSFLTKTITKYIPNISYETFESEIKKK